MSLILDINRIACNGKQSIALQKCGSSEKHKRNIGKFPTTRTSFADLVITAIIRPMLIIDKLVRLAYHDQYR
ncbi:MAG: hypothetical protein IPH57_08425 [Saprospiraceae bacterium]|nr:hypothetical protein [Saprospiraceae bacterium]